MNKLPYDFDLLYDVKTYQDVEDVALGQPTRCEGTPEDLVRLFLVHEMEVPKSLESTLKGMRDRQALLKVLDCLIDTTERTTDLNNVYDDNQGTSVTWEEVERVRDALNLMVNSK